MKQIEVQTWLEQFCKEAPGVSGALAVAATEREGVAKLAAWPKDAGQSPPLVVAARVALQSGAPLSHAPPRAGESGKPVGQVIAVPLRNGARTVAAVAVGIESANEDDATQCRRRLREAMQHFGRVRRPDQAPDARDSLRVLAALLRAAKFQEAAVAAAAELAGLLKVDRASIGWIRGRDAEVIAESAGTEVDAGRQVHRETAEAMDEAISQRELIIHPPLPNDPPRITQAHAALARRNGGVACTVPLVSSGRVVGALLLEHHGPIALDAARRAFVEHAGTVVGSILELKYRAELPLRERARQAGRSAAQAIVSRDHLAIKVGAGLVLAALAAAVLVPVSYRIGAVAHLEGATQRALVAPADGYLQQVHVRPGDMVRADQVLAQLADDELALEQRRWAAELEQHESAYGAAFAHSDRGQMVLHMAKADEARAQLELAVQKLARARVTAPFDGLVIRGDLSDKLGSPVKRGDLLLTVAPHGEFRIIVNVDERDIADVREGQTGSLALASLPGSVFPIRIDRVTPVASAASGRNAFEVEARLTGAAPPALRPGLEGVAKIEAGEQPLAWIWTRRLVNWLRLSLWSWGL